MKNLGEIENPYHITPAFLNGAEIRAAVMGKEYVRRSLENAHRDGETTLQQLVTEFAWGTVWARPNLDRKQRSLATVSMLIPQHRPMELAGHFRGALANGLTTEELHEVIIHASVYCGFPAAQDARRQLMEVLGK